MVRGIFDPRIAKAGSGNPSKKGIDSVKNLTWKEDASQAPVVPDPRSIEEFAQRNKRVPIMSSIVDRTKTDTSIHEINGVPLSRPVMVEGGDDYMFRGLLQDPVLFANQPVIANRHLQVARAAEDQFGVPPLFAPHYMSPTGVDFSTATAETGMAHAFEVLSPQAKKELDKLIREKGFDVAKTRDLPDGTKQTYIKNYKIENWAGIDDPLSVHQLRIAPADLRKAIVNRLGTKNFFESEGFLSPGAMRTLVTKPELMNVRDGTFGNFGIFNTAGDLTRTTHKSYATGFPGEGVSPIIEAGNIGPYNFTDLQKAYARDASGIPIDTLRNSQGVPRTETLLDPNNPSSSDLTALGKNITFSVLDDKQLERFKALGMVGIPGLVAGTASASAPEFIDRINNPQNHKFILNGDGSISTHRMAAEQGSDGNWYVFPTIQQMPNGELKEFVLPNGDPDNMAAMINAMASNNMLQMKDKESALAFAEGSYKVGTPLETFNPMQRTMQDNIDSMLNPKPGANDRLSESPRGPIAGILSDALFGVKDYFSEMPDVGNFAKNILGTGFGAEIAGAQGKYAPITTSPSILGEIITGQIPEALDKISRGEASSNLTGEEMFDLGTGAIGAGFTGGKLLRASKPVLNAAGEKFVDIADSASQRLGLSPQVAPSGPRGPNVNAMGFYSAVENAAMNLNRKSGSGQSFLNDIRKAPNIKDSEIKWMGLDEFLKGKKNVTSEEVQRYIRDNRVDVQEITYQDNPYDFTEDYEFEEYINELDPEIDGYELENAQYFYREFLKGGTPQNAEWSTEGGKNLREIVFTLPENATPEVYQTSHYPRVNNVLAHMRTADHKSDDGKKVLLLDEIQSDWHQAGRGTPDDKGKYTDPQYITDFEGMQATRKEYVRVGKEIQEKSIKLGEKYDLNPEAYETGPFDGPDRRKRNFKYAMDEVLNPLSMKLKELKNKLNSYGTVPDAPFKDEWYSVALKRAAKIASDEGYDRIALTTARTQADRYGYRKTAGEIEFIEEIGVVITDSPHEYIQLGNKTLEDIFGKKLANKIRNAPEVEREVNDFVSAPTSFSFTEKVRTLKNEDGSDIEYGYDGFKHYYDKAYVDSMKKIAKKFKSRVYMGKLENGDDVMYMDITPEMKSGTKAGQTLFSAAPVAPVGGGLLSSQQEDKKNNYGLLF